MIKKFLRVAALSLVLSPLALPSSTAAAAPSAPAAAEVLGLADAVKQIPVAEESRDGYTRNQFKHWNTGLDPADGCNTRVLQPSAGPRPVFQCLNFVRSYPSRDSSATGICPTVAASVSTSAAPGSVDAASAVWGTASGDRAEGERGDAAHQVLDHESRDSGPPGRGAGVWAGDEPSEGTNSPEETVHLPALL